MILRDFRLTLETPDDWYGRIFQIIEPTLSAPTIEFGTVEVDPNNGGFGAVRSADLGKSDVAVAIVNAPSHDFYFTRKDTVHLTGNATFALQPRYFVGFQGVPSYRSAATAPFTCNERVFELLAVFGSANPPLSLISEVNHVLASLKVRPEAGKEMGGNGELVRLGAAV